MRFKLLFVMTFALTLLVTGGCSVIKKVVYKPNINQGNYLLEEQVARLQVGMTKEQVLYLLGTPMLHDPFGTDTWFYVFRQQLGHKDPIQQRVTLSFSGESLLNIQKEIPPASKQALAKLQAETQAMQEKTTKKRGLFSIFSREKEIPKDVNNPNPQYFDEQS